MNQYENAETAAGLLSRERTIPQMDIEIVKTYSSLDSQIIELGFGDAKLLLALQKNGFSNLTGVDSSEIIVQYGLENTKDVQILKMDVATEELPLRYDMVIAYHFFTSIIGRDERKKAIQNTVKGMSERSYLVIKSFISEDSKVIEVHEPYYRKIYIPSRDEYFHDFEDKGLQSVKENEEFENGLRVLYIVMKKRLTTAST